MSVSFETIQDTRTNTNHVEVSKSRAVQGLNKKPSAILVVGERLTGGSVEELIPKQVLSGDQADQYWNVGSKIAEMVRIAKLNNPTSAMWGCAIEPIASGTAGTKTITVVGPATGDGTIHLYIHGIYVPVGVTNGQVQNTIAANINAAIQASRKYKRMAFTSTVSTNAVTLTMKWKGADVPDVRVNYNNSDLTPAGLTVTVATGVAGAGNPDITAILDVLGTTWFDTIICPWIDSTNLGALNTELLRRFGGMVQKEGQAFAAVSGNFGTASTLGASLNSPFLSVMGANTSPSPIWNWAAALGAVDAGQDDPAMPRQTLRLLDILPCAPSEQWEDSDRNLLLYSGIATHTDDGAGNVSIERLITTYQKNEQNVPDESFLDIETMRTLSAIRYDNRSSVSLAFPRYKLASGTKVPPGQKIMTETLMRAHLLSRFDKHVEAGWVEGAARDRFLKELVVERDPVNLSRLRAQAGPDLMNQFRGLSMQLAYIL